MNAPRTVLDPPTPDAAPAQPHANPVVTRTAPAAAAVGLPVDARTAAGPPSAQAHRPDALAEAVVRLGFATVQQVREAMGTSGGDGVADALVRLGVVSRQQLAHANAVRSGVEVFDFNTTVDPAAFELLNERSAHRYQAVPVRFDPDGTVVVAMADPANVFALDDLKIVMDRPVRPVLASAEDIAKLIAQAGRLDSVVAQVVDQSDASDDRSALSVADITDTSDDAPVVRLVNSIIARGVQDGASDIHFEPQAREVLVRFRIDGVLRSVTQVPLRFANGVSSRIKIMSDLDISERRVPQDGRVALQMAGRNLDLRVATLPTVHGEKIVIRVLDRSNVVHDLADLGFADDTLERFRSCYTRPYGAVLVTGPTGSGKSTTLYGTLNQLNSVDRNIITVEDPVEYRLAGVNQVQVNLKAGMSFAAGLRSILRCDPDVVMIGEVRDRETAKIAIESALTGHLVLATLHTNDAAGALARLTEMGVEPFLSSSAVSGILAQRLARRLCEHCREPHMVPASALRALVAEGRLPASLPSQMQVYRPGGCSRCGGSGYRGRMGVYEMLVVSPAIESLMVTGASADEISRQAMAEGMRTLREDGLMRVMRGETSLDELARAVG